MQRSYEHNLIIIWIILMKFTRINLIYIYIFNNILYLFIINYIIIFFKIIVYFSNFIKISMS